MAAFNVSFNGYALQNSTFRTRVIQHTNIPSKVIQAETRARADGLTIVNVKYSSREVIVEGQFVAATRDALVQKIDELKLNLNGISGVLDIDYGNSTRRYYATVSALDIPEDFYSLTAVPYKITFFCSDPFGYATNSGNLAFNAQSAMLLDTVITMSGSINSEPVVTLTLSTVVNMALLTLSNESTGESIVISKPGGNFANSDVVLIDSVRKRVYINNSGVDYTGRFPTLQANGVGQRLRVAIQATSALYNLAVVYSPRYL